MATTVRSLKIKTSTCKRIVKELHSYEKEVEREAAKTADMTEKGADPHDLKQQVYLLPLHLLSGDLPHRVMCYLLFSVKKKLCNLMVNFVELICILTGKCVGRV